MNRKRNKRRSIRHLEVGDTATSMETGVCRRCGSYEDPGSLRTAVDPDTMEMVQVCRECHRYLERIVERAQVM